MRGRAIVVAVSWCGCAFHPGATGGGSTGDADVDGDTQGSDDASLDAGCLAPAAQWLFDDGSGTTAADSSGHGNGLTLHSAGWATGKNGSALELAGGAWAERPFASTFVAQRKLSATAWVNPADIRFGGIVVKSARFGPLMDWGFYVDTPEASFLWNYEINQTYPSVRTTGLGLPTNAWSHLAFVVDVDASTVSFYLNGVLFQALPITTQLAQHDTEPIAVGTDGGNSANDFVGKLDEITVWTRALTANEVATLYAGDCLR